MQPMTTTNRSKSFPAAARWALLPVCLALFGCGLSQQKPPDPNKPRVEVSIPVSQEVTDYEDYTGNTASKPSVELRARVSGYLEKVLFKEGMEVKEGDPLFLIDRRPYQDDYDHAVANLEQAKAHLTRVTADYHRAEELLPMKAISQSDFDLAKGDHDEALASVNQAKAALETSKQNLDWTLVIAPVSGRISRQMIDPGNLVKADDTVLTSIVLLDPIYVYFFVDERSMLRFRRLLHAGKVKSAQDARVPVLLGLSDEAGYPHEGVIDFVDNHVDQMTGTLTIRGQFPNGDRLLSPGMFARIRVPIGSPHEALLVSERALGSDQGRRFVYVVDKDDKVVYRPVEIGLLRNGLRVIEKGLSPGERIVLSGLQQIKSGDTVQPEVVEMTAEEPAAAPPSAVAASPPAAAPQPAGTKPAAATKRAAGVKPAAPPKAAMSKNPPRRKQLQPQ
jgi:RND family efflux transporter MFP subunit